MRSFRTVLTVLLLGLALRGAAVGQEEAPGAAPAAPVFEDGQAQAVPAFKDRALWIQHELWVETEFDSDGDGKRDRVHVDVTRPQQTDTEGLKVPVVYETSPYFAGTGSTNKEKYFWNPRQELGESPPARTHMPVFEASIGKPVMSKSQLSRWVPRGFAVVHSASPGTGLSEGCPTVGGENESLAPKAVIDWLNGRARGFTTVDGDEEVEAFWCTGKVGMTGTSYNGTLALAAATTGVEGLEAIIPIAPNTSYYHYYRSNGLIRHPGGWMGEDIDVLYEFISSGGAERREICDCKVRDEIMLKSFDRVNGDSNDFWASRDYLNQLDDVRAATLMAHAFNDWNVMPEHSVRIALALKQRGVPVQMYFHQGGHGGAPPFATMNKWFTHYLYGVGELDDEPGAWIVREGDRRRSPTAYQDYPHPRAAPVTVRPVTKGSRLAREVDGAQGVASFTDDVQFDGATLAQEELPHRLLYRTGPLEAPLHLSGTARIELRLAVNRPAANLSVWLVSLPWTRSRLITDNIVTRGWADPQNHRSLTVSEPLEPGTFYDLAFDLQPDDQIIPEGQELALMIFSSDRDFTLWPAAGTELTVDLDATRLTLPVVGGEAAFDAAVKPTRDL